MKSSAILLVLASALCLCSYVHLQATNTSASDGVDINICTRSPDEQKECEFLTTVALNSSDGMNWSCVQADDSKSWMELIKEGKCNMITDLDAHELFDVNKDYQFEPIVAEDYKGNGDGLSYFAIAVVPKAMCAASNNDNLTVESLQGLKSCHTGYKRTSGWTIPLATIMGSQIAENGQFPEGTKDTDILPSFFSEMCAPGYSGDNATAKEIMCSLCQGDCSSSTANEQYVGYDGALRCLMDRAGDVAFVKHSTPLDYALDGNDPQEWSSMAKEDLRLICPEGGCAELDDFENCNFARVPSHMIAAQQDLPAESIQSAFTDAAMMPEFQEMFFGDTPSQMFKKGTKGLIPINTPTTEYLGKLGNIYSVLEDNGYY